MPRWTPVAQVRALVPPALPWLPLFNSNHQAAHAPSPHTPPSHPFPTFTPPRPPAGDAYAAGLLYGYLRHMDLVGMGRTAARVASAVIARHGATLTPDAAAALVQAAPASKGAAQGTARPSAAQQPGAPTVRAPSAPLVA